MNSFANFLKRIYAYRAFVKAMAFQEIKGRYAGTLGGGLWAVLHPLMMILVFWFVFSVGFKIQVKGDIP